MRLKTFLFVICGSLSLQCHKVFAATTTFSPSTPDENVTEAPACSIGEFRCNDGVCVSGLARCNGTVECPDQSDESSVFCRNYHPLSSLCTLPPGPEFGSYVVSTDTPASPGGVETVFLNYTCKAPYKLVGNQQLQCYRGLWSGEFPTCKRYCSLYPHPSVRYRCLVSGSRSLEGSRVCGDEEPSGTVVKPVCRTPNYYYPGTISLMHCENGKWDSVTKCKPECGRMTPKGTKLVAGGRPAERDELPWHTGIYSKLETPYMQICGGSILNGKMVISAAHCFWRNQERLPAQDYAIAAGKLYREWDHPEDSYAQKRDVHDIKIPARYQGVTTNFQDDIALVVLKRVLEFTVHVRPVCIDFDHDFDNRQLQAPNMGKVAGWGLNSEDGIPSPYLKVVELPYVSIEECIENTPLAYKEYITSDKICAGYTNGTSVCKGDSGGGLSFPEPDRAVMRYYLRGIVSTAPGSEHLCNTVTVTSFTHLNKQQNFIKMHFKYFATSGFQFFNSQPTYV